MCLCMWDGSSEYSTPMDLDFLSSFPVCVFWFVHLDHLYLTLILLCVNLVLTFCYWLVVLPASWCSFFNESLFFTIWYVFAVAGSGCFFPCLVLLLADLVRHSSGDKISKQLLVCNEFYFSFTYAAYFGWIWNSGLKVLFLKNVEYWPPLSSGL